MEEELSLESERVLGGFFPEAAYTLHVNEIAGRQKEEHRLDELRN